MAFRRQPILCDEAVRVALRKAISSVREQKPFTIDAWVLLPTTCSQTQTLGIHALATPFLEQQISNRSDFGNGLNGVFGVNA